MSYITIKSDISSQELELVLYKGKYTVNVVAYGDWYEEEFDTLEQAEQYLVETWHFRPNQLQEIKDKMEII